MKLPGGSEIESASRIVHGAMRPTLQHTWPLLNQRLGAEAVAQARESHAGGIVQDQGRPGLLPASQAFATGHHARGRGDARKLRTSRWICRAPGGHGSHRIRSPGEQRIQEPRHARLWERPWWNTAGISKKPARKPCGAPARRICTTFPSFHELLVAGVATYSVELFSAVAGVDVAYVPIGLGSGICGMVAAREALGLKTDIVGVVSRHAPAYYESFVERRPVARPAETRIADGVACSAPDPDALEIIWRHVARVVMVTDDEIADGYAHSVRRHPQRRRRSRRSRPRRGHSGETAIERQADCGGGERRQCRPGSLPRGVRRQVTGGEGGFEPPVELMTLRRFSKPLLSTTQPPLREMNWSVTASYHKERRFDAFGSRDYN